MQTFKKTFFLLLMLCTSINSYTVSIFESIKKYNLQEVASWIKLNEKHTIHNEKGQSILHVAVLTSKDRMVKAILKSNVAINDLDNAKKTALDYAIESNSKNIILRLTQRGAKVTSHSNALYLQSMFKNQSSLLLALGLGSLLSFGFFGLGLFALGALNVSASLICAAQGFHYKFESEKIWLLN